MSSSGRSWASRSSSRAVRAAAEASQTGHRCTAPPILSAAPCEEEGLCGGNSRTRRSRDRLSAILEARCAQPADVFVRDPLARHSFTV